MSDEPTPYVRALADEYRMSQHAKQDVRLICVAEELTRHGWNVTPAGELVRIQERAVVRPAAETPEKPAPKRRGRSAE